MVKVTFLTANGLIRGFHISGHALAGASGKDIVCAAVSSAAYLTANTVTDVMDIEAGVQVDEKAGTMRLELTEEQAERAKEIIKGLELHLRGLEKIHGNHIKVIYGGV